MTIIAGIRDAMFPYAMTKNPDGSWTLLNRRYKPVGEITDRHVNWDDDEHRLFIKGMSVSVMQKLSIDRRSERIDKDCSYLHLYDDATAPERSPENMKAYLAKLEILLKTTFDHRAYEDSHRKRKKHEIEQRRK